MTPQGNTFGNDGAYNAQGSNDMDSLNAKPSLEVVGDWSSIPDLKGFQAGDTAMLHVKVKLGGGGTPDENDDAAGASGNDMEVLSVKADPMEDGAKASRGRVGDPNAPDLMGN